MASTNPIAQNKKQKAFRLLNQGRVQEAIPILEQVVKRFPRDLEALSALGTIYGQSGQLEPAVHYLERVVAINPNDLDTLNNLGVTYMMLGDKEKACEHMQHIVHLQPGDIGALYNLACILQELGKHKSSIEYFMRVLEAEPRAIDALINLGVSYKETGDYQEAIQTFRRALELDASSPEANLNLGRLLARSGNKDEALQYFEKAAALAPHDYEKIYALANMRVLEGRPDDAIALFEKALSENTDDVRLYSEYARLLFSIGKLNEALIPIDKGLELDPDNIKSLILQARVYKELSFSRKIIETLNRALQLDPDNIEAILVLASQMNMDGYTDKAMDIINNALSRFPDNQALIGSKVEILHKIGKYDEAVSLLEPLLDLPTKNHNIAIRFAHLCKHMGRIDEAITYLNDLLSDYTDSLPVNMRRDLLFALGRLYNDLKEPDKAFPAFEKANALKSLSFNCEQHHSLVDALKTVFSADNLSLGVSAENDSSVPIFIVGMPRSGTSLTEQIIASHHDVYGAGELNTISQTYNQIKMLMASRAAKGEALELTVDDCNKYAQKYLDELAGYSDSARRITDKMPNNFLYLGMIQQFFPGTRIIHTLRNPLDVCLSIYTLDFAGRHEYAYNLENLGCFYNEYRRIMKHWKEVLTIPVMNIRYEDLVNDQESWSRKLIDFCGLEWDDACLDFHKSKRIVNTASNQQVRQPIYKGSMQRWRPYEKHLQPLIDALEPEYRKEAGVENWDY